MKVHILDLLHQGYERAIAAYLVEGPDQPLLIETGPMSTLETLKLRLRERDLQPSDVRHVFVTHVHLDHAGAAGWWAQQGATVYVHSVGAPHIVDPSRLWRSAGRIYGDKMEALWGEMLPAPAERVVALGDGDVTRVGGLAVTAWDTPGHAWHHHTYQLDDLFFTGDVAGVQLQPEDWVSLPAPPPEFDREAWQRSLARLLALQPRALYLTHFGKIETVESHLEELSTLIEEASAFIYDRMEEGLDREALMTAYRQWNEQRARRSHTGLAAVEGGYEAANPLFMSVDGIMRYWRKKNEQQSS